VQPESCFLAHVHADIFDLAIFEQILAALIDQKLRVPEQVAVVSDKPVRPRTFGFFIADGEKDDVTVQRHLLALQHDHGYQLRQPFILHVLSTAAPQVTILDVAAEGRNLPVRGVAGDHVHVVQQNDWALCLSRGVGKPRPQIGTPGRVFENLGSDALVIEDLLQEHGRTRFISRRIGRVDAQVLLHPGDGEVGILLQVSRRNARRGHRSSLGIGIRIRFAPGYTPQQCDRGNGQHAKFFPSFTVSCVCLAPARRISAPS